MYRILVIEDDSRIATFIQKALNAEDFTAEIAPSGHAALTKALGGNFDLLILELDLPDQDGLQVIEALRGQGETVPIIILTARDDIHDKVAGLERGADDYMTKPFRFEELLARTKARLRRPPHIATAPYEKALCVANVELNLRTRRVRVGNRVISLPAREFTLAETFLRHPGQVLSREQLLDRIWGYDYSPGSNVVDVYVGYLRKKLGRGLIETVRGMGYRLRTE
ncbi:MAG: response regulator transcription factor [Leptolyngbya sp. SIO1E4]|nr:response regulator transcription factor [Leptolyngbya sp. SIO1E4]